MNIDHNNQNQKLLTNRNGRILIRIGPLVLTALSSFFAAVFFVGGAWFGYLTNKAEMAATIATVTRLDATQATSLANYASLDRRLTTIEANTLNMSATLAKIELATVPGGRKP